MKSKLNQVSAIVAFTILLCHAPHALAQSSVDQTSQTGMATPAPGADGNTYNYQADLFTGRFTYGVPITVAPGRQGAEPKITLGYNSAAGNGWCGVGWSLDMGYIQRDTRHGVPIAWAQAYTVSGGTTNYLDHDDPLPQYDDSKGFVSSFGNVSSPLVCVSAANQNPVVYRQQVDTAFLTYEYFTNNNYWEVIDKSGNTFFFGEATNCQMENSKTNWPQGVGSSTFRWALDRVLDINGNETFLNYTTIGGTLYLTNIMYNANTNAPAIAATHEVDFILTNRPDTNFTFISGCRVTSSQLLSEIDVKVSGQNVRKYALGYTQSSSTLRSLLTSVTQYGSDFASALPPLTFSYSVDTFTFGPDTNWPGLFTQGHTNDSNWGCIRGYAGGDGETYLETMDMDGDGLPDRVMRQYTSPFNTFFAVERNTGSGFAITTTNSSGTLNPQDYPWGPLTLGNTQPYENDPEAQSATAGYTYLDLVDINGDGYPDWVNEGLSGPYTNWNVQLSSGLPSATTGLGSRILWTNVDDSEVGDPGNPYWHSILYNNGSGANVVGFMDMNGDGLPDRVKAEENYYTNWFKVQINNGSGFTRDEHWGPLGTVQSVWDAPSFVDGNGCYDVILMDMNGDGLPDRVIRSGSAPYTHFSVQFNNGAGFEPGENWGPVNTRGNDNASDWGSPICCNGANVWATLVDMTGCGMPAHVLGQPANPDDVNWIVQLNTGTGFSTNLISWGPISSQGQSSSDWNNITYRVSNNSETIVDLFDINGDGLPDRVMARVSGPYTNYVVQLNQGPFPDLMNVVSNGLGGSAQISYIASTTLNNRSKDWTNDPWAEGATNLLPFNVWVVSQIVTSDGMGNNSTNSYAFKGGYYNSTEREFRGFSQCIQTDPLGTQTITYFHQSGGRDNSVLGEYLDQGSESKKGMPFRIDVISTNGTTNKITLNKVEEIELNTNGWFFPYISQSIVMNYEGSLSYRAIAYQFKYDTNNENLAEEADLGEVTNVVFNGQSFTQVGSDQLYTWMTYNSFGKPSDTKITSDSAGSTRLRETQLSYDSRGNVTQNQIWLDTLGSFITQWNTVYDQYGNPIQSTDAAGLTTYSTYDSTYIQYSILKVIATFTNQYVYDPLSGNVILSIDPKGLVSSNSYDALFRNTGMYISTSAYGPASVWKTKTSYQLGGASGGLSTNYILKQINDTIDPVSGLEAYSYLDGMGREIQSRTESETSGQFRVINTVYDLRGNLYFQTLPYFSSGSAFEAISGSYLGLIEDYDGVGRTNGATPAVQGTFAGGLLAGTTLTRGDSGSPMGPITSVFGDGSNPWATVVTDSEGKVTKTYNDDRNRKIKVTQITSGGNYNTLYSYDLFGNLTNVVDNAGNTTTIKYDSLGRKVQMVDPNVGTWSYAYDNDGRITNQVDSRGDKLVFNYNDPVGRLVSKQIYNSSGQQVGMISYSYDISDDPNYTVYKGQLYKVTDLQGYEKHGYDIRGRVLKNGRFLNVNAVEYVTAATYDDDDRVKTLTYPGNSAVVQYSYGLGGNIAQVQSLSGTGPGEIFYTATSYNALNQVNGYTNGNGVNTTFSYYPNSTRLENETTTFLGTNYQNLTYTYDTNSDVTSINDGVYSGSASASISAVTYDDLYRVTSVNSTARGLKTYSYDSIGNTLTNQDFAPNQYQYGIQPYAVTNANSVSYAYDACGNMVARGGQTLTYDAQNQLIKVSMTNDVVTFGYDDDGKRLWRCGTNGYSVWVGGIYEINNGKILCHVIVDGKLVATFEPQCNAGLAKVFGEKNWYLASATMESAVRWPFKNGRGHWSLFTGAWLAILGTCLIAGRGIRTRRYEFNRLSRRSLLWNRIVTIASISAFLWNSTGTVEATTTYNPVFYYYHLDNLGSSNILTDRSGNLVQHYQYTTFGATSYENNTSAFPVSNRYTGQIADDETGLYYYNARYYDSQLGRFIQPDAQIQFSSNPQNLNRYNYCDNNPLNYTDPTGNFLWILVAYIAWQIVQTVVLAAAAAAAIGAVTAAIEGKDIAAAALNGALNAALSQLVGGIASSVILAAIHGQNIGQAALVGAVNTVIGFGTTELNIAVIGSSVQNIGQYAEYTAIRTASGSLTGAVDAEIEGKNVGQGALNGAVNALKSSAEALAKNYAEYEGEKIAQRWGITKFINGSSILSLGHTLKVPIAPLHFSYGVTFDAGHLFNYRLDQALKGQFIPFYNAYEKVWYKGMKTGVDSIPVNSDLGIAT